MNSERFRQLLKQSAFLTCSWRFLRSNTLEQLELKLDKNKWHLETYRKRQKIISEEQKAGDVIHHHSSMQKKKCTYVRIKYVCICIFHHKWGKPFMKLHFNFSIKYMFSKTTTKTCQNLSVLKFGHSEKATKIWNNLPLWFDIY